MRLPRPDPDYIRRLEEKAARNLAVYRFKVGALALLGDLTLTVVQLLPIVLPIGVGLFVLNAALVSGSLAMLNWAGVAAMVLLVWLTRPQHRFDGTPITPNDAPEFFQVLDTLREKLGVPNRMRVMLDDEFNASAAETRGVLGILCRQQTLTLGIPLLCVLTREQMLAVIGHEFGHFSRRHGRLGHWLYRARGGWMLYAQDVTASDTIWERAAAAFAERFVPYFSAYSFVLARQCEYEADADGASATSARDMAHALTRVSVYGRLWHGGFRKEVNRWRLMEAQAPADYIERFQDALPRWSADELDRWRKQAIDELPNWIDTHPRLIERTGALKQEAALGGVQGSCAGEALFGDKWPEIRQQFNQRWLTNAKRKWSFYHLYRTAVVQPLLDADEARVAAWPLEQQLLRAEARMDHHRDSACLTLTALAQRHTDNAEVSLRAGFALSEYDPDSAMALLKRAATLNPSYRAQSFRGLSDLHECLGNGKEADRYAMQFDLSARQSERAYQALEKSLMDGDVSVSPLLASAKSLMASTAEADDCVAELWLFARDVEVPLKLAGGEQRTVTYPMQFGLWVIDPEALRRNATNEEHVTERYTGYLQTLLPSNVLVAGKAVYTTENRERWIADLMAKFPQACCFMRVSPIPAS